MLIKGKIDKHISSKIFCSAKDPGKKTERKAKDWDKRFANHMSDKGLLPRIHK